MGTRRTAAAAVALLIGGALLAPPAEAGPHGPGPAPRLVGVHEGHGEGYVVRAGDLDGRPGEEIVHAGRGIAVLDGRDPLGSRPLWTFHWTDEPELRRGGDNDWATGVELVQARGDRHPELLVTTVDGDVYLLDGRRGTVLWHRVLRNEWGRVPINGFALLDADDDAVPDLALSGVAAVLSGRTGEQLWTPQLPRAPYWTVGAQLDGQGGRDVVMVVEPVRAIGQDPPRAEEVFAYRGDGTLLWAVRPPVPAGSVAAADLTGDGRDEVLVGDVEGGVSALDGATGRLLWRTVVGQGAIRALTVGDADRDGRPEVYAGAGVYPEIVALGPDGARRWTVEAADQVSRLELADLDGDGADELVATQSQPQDQRYGGLRVVDPRRGTTRWSVDTGAGVLDLAPVRSGSRTLLAAGTTDGLLRILDGPTGNTVGTWRGGFFLKWVRAVDLDGRPGQELVALDENGLLSAADTTGEQRWHRQVIPDAEHGVAAGLAVAAARDGTPVVVAAAEHVDSYDVLVAYGPDGTLRWRRDVPLPVRGLTPARLSRDGGTDLVGVVPTEPFCEVVALDADTGAELWRTPTADCEKAVVAAGDVDGDGLDEVAYGEWNLFRPPHVALLDHDGALRWLHQVADHAAWVVATPGTVVSGGPYRDGGHVTVRTGSEGTVRWQSEYPSEGGRDGTSRFGTLLPDLTGDGVAEVGVSFDTGVVRALDGADGTEVWSTTLVTATDPLDNRGAGPLVVTGMGRHARLVVGEYAVSRIRAGAHVLGLDGTPLDRVPTRDVVYDAALLDLPGNRSAVAAAAGLSVYVVRVS